MSFKGVAKGMILAAVLALPAAAAADSFLDWLVGAFNLRISSAQMKGPDDDGAVGGIWLCNLERGGTVRLTPDGGYRSPLFALKGSDLFALKGDALIRIRTGSVAEEVRKVPGVVRLVAFDRTDSDRVLVLLENETTPLGVLSLKGGAVEILPFDPGSDDHKLALAGMKRQARTVGATKVYVKKVSRQGLVHVLEWTDIIVKKGGGEPQNVSNCDGVNCSQPALSPDGGLVTFIRSDE